MASLYTIIADTREQAPYTFGRVPCVRRKLDAGDYSVEGLETTVTVERKSLDDFVSTVIRQRKRFNTELAKLQTYKYSCIVVEASVRDLITGNFSSSANPEAALGAAISLDVDYRIPVIFCGDRQGGVAFTKRYLCRVWEKERK